MNSNLVEHNFYIDAYFNNNRIISVTDLLGLSEYSKLTTLDYEAVIQQLYAEYKGWA